MKKMKRSTWIAIICVLLAIAASQIYGTIGTEKAENDTVTMISEITPTIQETANSEKEETPELKNGQSSESITSSIPTEPEIKTEAAIKTEAEIETEEVSRPVSAPIEVSTPAPISFSLPSTGETGTKYSDKELIYFSPIKEWRCHLGTDFLPAETDAVFAAADGKVEKIYEDHLFGTTVLIAHADGYKTYYSSLSEVMVNASEDIKCGQEIARMGQTAAIEEGVHLHFAMEKDGKCIDPLGGNH